MFVMVCMSYVCGGVYELLCLCFAGETCNVRGPCVDNTCSNQTTLRCEQDVHLNNYTCVCEHGEYSVLNILSSLSVETHQLHLRL